MMKKALPFSPFPIEVLKHISSKFLGIGESISMMFPYLESELQQAEIPLEKKEYCASMFIISLFYFVIFSLVIAVITNKLAPQYTLVLSPTIGLAAALMIFIQLSVYPKIAVRKKVRDLERNLVFALRTILVQLKSGVSLFDALGLVAKQDYGVVSKEFKKALDAITTGTLEEEALQKLAIENPSPFFRKSLWQLVNGLKGGVDVSSVISEVVSTLNKEQQIQIRRYGASLSLFSLMYMMLGVIVPALGITFMIILGSFPQITITEIVFWILLVGIIISEFMYIGMIKSKRPSLMGEG